LTKKYKCEAFFRCRYQENWGGREWGGVKG
jgi:hypothetical protein